MNGRAFVFTLLMLFLVYEDELGRVIFELGGLER